MFLLRFFYLGIVAFTGRGAPIFGEKAHQPYHNTLSLCAANVCIYENAFRCKWTLPANIFILFLTRCGRALSLSLSVCVCLTFSLILYFPSAFFSPPTISQYFILVYFFVSPDANHLATEKVVILTTNCFVLSCIVFLFSLSIYLSFAVVVVIFTALVVGNFCASQ